MTKSDRIELGHLVVQIEAGAGDRAVYSFRGSLNEYFDYKRIPVHAAAEVLFDLSEVRTLNSCGVREWVYFVRHFAGKTRLILDRVAVSFVDQANTVPQMLGSGTVRSFFAPFYCPKCDQEVNELIVCETHREDLSKRRAPSLAHSACGRPLEFDALEDAYFHQAERFLG